ncbi:NAG5 [Candida oxycetoniae]|uniref:Phosphotransferase n=1 Tax=Candida oxycetoniae TaxID=497107 RepID=A0AAI9SXI5_9ASCO|nr:NAG5 [Candida oxycetoniae]KAI3404537.2 NAG5 [Candida oxycetoniae]
MLHDTSSAIGDKTHIQKKADLDPVVDVTKKFASMPNEPANDLSNEEEYKSLASSTTGSFLSSPRHSPVSTTTESEEEESNLLEKIAESFTSPLTQENLTIQSQLLLNDFRRSLGENGISMVPSYNLSPDGSEHGQYLVIDLGGSTLRIAVIDISPDLQRSRSERVHIVLEEKWIISNEYKNIDRNFFKFIGSKIMEILSRQDLIKSSSLIKTGMTWSFPLETTSYNSGNIRHVSKGYTLDPEVCGKDLKFLLESILHDEFGIKIDVRSVMNDSVAVYSAGSFLDDKLILAMVLGTGFNMCCPLNADAEKMHKTKLIDDKLLFNTELSLFGEDLCDCLGTKYDAMIDKRLQNFKHHFKPYTMLDPEDNTAFQPNELLTSGRYLPEISRLIMVDLYNKKELFSQYTPEELGKILNVSYDGFEGELMCFVDENSDYEEINKKFLDCYGWSKPVEKSDITKIKTITSFVIKRAAFIVANSIIAFLKLLSEYNTDNNKIEGLITIGYVGSVLTYFINYRNMVLDYVNTNEEVKKLGCEIKLELIENSSVIGAAIGAAFYSKD